jgi:hypothetical protein
MTAPTVFYACALLSKPTENWVAFRFPHGFIKARPCGTWEVYGAFPVNMPPEKQEFGTVCSAKEYFYVRDHDGQVERAQSSMASYSISLDSMVDKSSMPEGASERYWCGFMEALSPMVMRALAMEGSAACISYTVFKRPSGTHEVYCATRSSMDPPPFTHRRELTRDEFKKYTEIAPESPLLGVYGAYVGIRLDMPASGDEEKEEEESDEEGEEDKEKEDPAKAREIAYIRDQVQDLPPRCIIETPNSHRGDGVYWVTNGNISHQGYGGDIGAENAFRDLPPLADTALVGGATYSANFRGAWLPSLANEAAFELAEVDPSGEQHRFKDGLVCSGDELGAQPGERLFRTRLAGRFGPWVIYILAPPRVDRGTLVKFLSESHWYRMTPDCVICSIANEKLLYEEDRD